MIFKLMTLEPITKEEMLYIKARDKTAITPVTNKEHIKGKTRYLELTTTSLKYLKEIRAIQESKIIEKHGWFTEEYTDKYGQKKVHEVFYK